MDIKDFEVAKLGECTIKNPIRHAEFVDDFAIYFDQFKYTTHTLDNIYDGFDLRDIDFDAVNNGGQ